MIGFSVLPSLSTPGTGSLFSMPPPDKSSFLDNPAYAPRTTVERPSNMGVNLGGAATGAASGAATGTAITPGWGTLIGGVVGGIAGLFSPKPKEQATPTAGTGASVATGSNGGLLDAFTKGLGSIPGIPGFGGGGGGPVTQTQSVGQSNDINITNVLGGQPFAGATATGDFDTFQAIADVFKIKDAQDRAAAAATNSGGLVTAAPPAAAKPMNYLPIVAAAAGILAIYSLSKKK